MLSSLYSSFTSNMGQVKDLVGGVQTFLKDRAPVDKAIALARQELSSKTMKHVDIDAVARAVSLVFI